jgi:transposase
VRETIGEFGHSKDHRPDRKQVVVGAVIDATGRPSACELWPGNVTDVTTSIPVVDRLRTRVAIGQVCTVVDRGMIARQTLKQLEQRGLPYILGARMRRQNEVTDDLLARAGRRREVTPKSRATHDPSPLKVKEV